MAELRSDVLVRMPVELKRRLADRIMSDRYWHWLVTVFSLSGPWDIQRPFFSWGVKRDFHFDCYPFEYRDDRDSLGEALVRLPVFLALR